MRETFMTKSKLLSLAVLLSASPAAMAGGGGASVGDLHGYGEDAYFATPQQAAAPATPDISTVGDSPRTASAADSPLQLPVWEGSEGDGSDANLAATPLPTELPIGSGGPENFHPVAFVGDSPSHAEHVGDMPHTIGSGTAAYESVSKVYEGDYGSASIADCGSARTVRCAPARRRSMKRMTDAWMTAEALIWFPKGRSAPALVTENPDETLPPELDQGAVSLFGGQSSQFPTRDAFEGDVTGGFRLDGGLYLTKDFGVGGRFWWLAETEDDFAYTGTGNTRSIGRPFFNLDPTSLSEDAFLINFDDGNPATDSFNGSVTATSSLEMYGAEAYARMAMLTGSNYRAELLGGYSHFGIDDELSMQSVSTQTTAPVNGAVGDQYSFTDLITAENRFNGGQLGIETSIQRGGWTLRALSKVHLGNMNQTFTANGNRSFIPAATPPAQVDATGGFLVLEDRTLEQDTFTFAPELNLKLGYQFRPNIALSVGYSFLYWDRVALVGDNLNNIFDESAILPPYPSPAANQPFTGLRESSMWVQGIDLGCIIDF